MTEMTAKQLLRDGYWMCLACDRKNLLTTELCPCGCSEPEPVRLFPEGLANPVRTK